jgi:hypothetical protein
MSYCFWLNDHYLFIPFHGGRNIGYVTHISLVLSWGARFVTFNALMDITIIEYH